MILHRWLRCVSRDKHMPCLCCNQGNGVYVGGCVLLELKLRH